MVSSKVVAFVFATIFSFFTHSVVASDLRETSIRQPRCRVGVCFAIDGSQTISTREFARERFLAIQIMENIRSTLPASFAAVQYGTSNQVIGELTSDRDFLRGELRVTEQLNSTSTFLSSGLNFCFSELFDALSDAPVCGRSIIVVMGDGNGDIGADPVDRARLFESAVRRGDVITVRFGAGADVEQLMEIGGTRRDFFSSQRTSIRSLATTIVDSLRI